MKQCSCCGRFFVPDKRVEKRQKACKREECGKSIKREAQKNWCEKNPEYFKNLYIDYVKPWRAKKKRLSSPLIKDKIPEKIKDEIAAAGIKDQIPAKMIKDEIPRSKPMVELVLLIPVDTAGMIKDEIRLRKVGAHRFAAYG